MKKTPNVPPSEVANSAGESEAAASTNFVSWIGNNKTEILQTLLCVFTIAYFVGFVPLFREHTVSLVRMAVESWDSLNNLEHAWLVPPIALYLGWIERGRLVKAEKGSSRWGLVVLAIGIALYLLCARSLQPRIGVVAIPFMLYGCVLYVWGRAVARILLFPIAFLLFTIPYPGLTQATVDLQVFVSHAAGSIVRLLGIPVEVIGTNLRATDQSFQFEIAGGCSGINSLVAVTTLTAIFAHLTQDRLWKKLVLFSLSGVFAIIGNVARIVAIMFVAKFFGQQFAAGRFHDISSWVITFPIALCALWAVSTLINWGRPKS